MTGGGWYAVRWNAAPAGPSWCTIHALDGLLHLVPVSGQNRIAFKRREGKSQLCPAVFLFFFKFSECHKGLKKAAFRITLIKSVSRLLYGGPPGRTQVEKQVKAALFSNG